MSILILGFTLLFFWSKVVKSQMTTVDGVYNSKFIGYYIAPDSSACL